MELVDYLPREKLAEIDGLCSVQIRAGRSLKMRQSWFSFNCCRRPHPSAEETDCCTLEPIELDNGKTFAAAEFIASLLALNADTYEA